MCLCTSHLNPIPHPYSPGHGQEQSPHIHQLVFPLGAPLPLPGYGQGKAGTITSYSPACVSLGCPTPTPPGMARGKQEQSPHIHQLVFPLCAPPPTPLPQAWPGESRNNHLIFISLCLPWGVG